MPVRTAEVSKYPEFLRRLWAAEVERVRDMVILELSSERGERVGTVRIRFDDLDRGEIAEKFCCAHWVQPAFLRDDRRRLPHPIGQGLRNPQCHRSTEDMTGNDLCEFVELLRLVLSGIEILDRGVLLRGLDLLAPPVAGHLDLILGQALLIAQPAADGCERQSLPRNPGEDLALPPIGACDGVVEQRRRTRLCPISAEPGEFDPSGTLRSCLWASSAISMNTCPR